MAAVTTLVTDDGVRIDAAHLPGSSDLVMIVAHGFTLSWHKPHVLRVGSALGRGGAGVLLFDFRGHGRSGGRSTLGDLEVLDLDAVIGWARRLGYRRIGTVGFSMGGSVVLRHAGLIGGVSAVVSVSGPGRWYYRGTERMRWVHYAVERRLGRLVTRQFLRTRISSRGWAQVPPVPPAEAAARIAPVPLLIVHGDRDLYFPAEHARQLYAAARDPKELWIIPGMGHAESGTSDDLAVRIATWTDSVTASPALPALTRRVAVPDWAATALGTAPQPRCSRAAAVGRFVHFAAHCPFESTGRYVAVPLCAEGKGRASTISRYGPASHASGRSRRDNAKDSRAT